MMHDCEKSHSAIVAAKPTNKARVPAAEPVEPRAGTERNAGEQSADTESGARVTGARARTASRKAQEEGEVHRALPPSQHRSIPGIVLRAQTRCRPGRGRADVADLRSRP